MDDLIPVRDEERLDVDSLAAWLSDRPLLPRGRPSIQQFAGGRANLTYLLTFPGGEELVLRRPPLGPVAPGSHDMQREHAVLCRLWAAFPKAPRALDLCQEATVIGSPFFLMERRGGVVVRDTIPEQFGGGRDPTANHALSAVIVDTLAELHAVDPATCGLDELGHPEGFLARQVSGWSGRWSQARLEDDPVADEVGAWLASRIPVSQTVTLVHNDWRLDNMAVSPDEPGTAVAVFDWDMATRGDPLADLGTLMASWYDPGESPAGLNPMPTHTPGWLPRVKAIARYGERTGLDLTDVDWYVVFGTWKLGIVLQQIYVRWHRGQTRDPRFETLGQAARDLFRLAAARRPGQ